MALFEIEEYDKSLEAFDMAIELNPKYIDAWLNKSMLLESMGLHEEAYNSYDKALKFSLE